MGPAEALRRIAYLLEAQGAQTYKVQAFRRAASTVDAQAPGELSRLAEQGRLETLPGVGKSTATVISEALSGSVPGYLQALEESVPVACPRSRPVAARVAAGRLPQPFGLVRRRQPHPRDGVPRPGRWATSTWP